MKGRSSVLSISQSPEPVNERLLSVNEAAQQLGVSKSWLYQSDVPYVKLGSRRLYRPTDVALYVNARVSHHLGLDDA